VTNNTKYTFTPKPEICDWIDEHIKSWTGFCYDNVYRLQKREYQQRFERLFLRIFIIITGMIMVSLAPMSLFVIPFLLLIGGGTTIIGLGFVMLFLEVRNGRRR